MQKYQVILSLIILQRNFILQRKVNVGKSNKGMQVLSTPSNLDIQESLESLDVLVGLVEKAECYWNNWIFKKNI